MWIHFPSGRIEVVGNAIEKTGKAPKTRSHALPIKQGYPIKQSPNVALMGPAVT